MLRPGWRVKFGICARTFFRLPDVQTADDATEHPPSPKLPSHKSKSHLLVEPEVFDTTTDPARVARLSTRHQANSGPETRRRSFRDRPVGPQVGQAVAGHWNGGGAHQRDFRQVYSAHRSDRPGAVEGRRQFAVIRRSWLVTRPKTKGCTMTIQAGAF